MAHKIGIVAASLIVAAAPSLATRPAPAAAPSASDSADARYCLRIEPVTGSLLETVRCWTRAEWDEQGVDVDKEWAKEGVAIIQ
jgi:hypothetical protein